MTDKELLFDVKHNSMFGIGYRTVTKENFLWLIRQAERLQELEIAYDKRQQSNSVLIERNKKLKNKLKSCHKALEKTQVAIQSNLKRANYKDEVILYEAYKKNEEVLEMLK